MGRRRNLWLSATLGVTIAAIPIAWALDPAHVLTIYGPGNTPGVALALLLFVGSSVHVASTGWLFTIPDVRAHARTEPMRYLYTPAALVLGAAVVAALTTQGALDWALLGYFAWQFFHFQRQNLGLVALTAKSAGLPSLTRLERRSIMASGLAGIAGLVAHPDLLQLSSLHPYLGFVYPLAETAFLVNLLVAVFALWRRRSRLSWGFALMFASSVGFFGPVFAFSSPNAAVGGLVIAHGLQYLLLVGLIAEPRRLGRYRVPALIMFVNIALLGGLVLTEASHLHGRVPLLRAFYGAYLGVVMAHFVIDAGLWRLRDQFPRKWLSESLPYLVPREAAKL